MSEPESSAKTAGRRASAALSGKKRDAPAIKTPELLEAICAGISLGRSARAMCAEAGISQRVLWAWLTSDAELMTQYLRAREMCIDAYAEEIIEISDDGSRDTYTDEKGKEVIDRDVIARSQLRIDTRKWYASRLAPKKYGDKLSAAQDGSDMGKPVVHRVEVAFITVPAAAGKPEKTS